MLEEKIEAEQAERKKERDENKRERDQIKQKLDMLLARLGGEGHGVGTGGDRGVQPKPDRGTVAHCSPHDASGTMVKVNDVSSSDAERAIPYPLPPMRGFGAESDAHGARRWPTTNSRGLVDASANPLSEFEQQRRLDGDDDVELSELSGRASDLRALMQNADGGGGEGGFIDCRYGEWNEDVEWHSRITATGSV